MQRSLDADRSALTANDPPPLPLVGIVDLLGELPIRQHVGGLTQEDDTYTAEINISSQDEKDSRVAWLFGAFYLDTDIESNTRNFFDGGRDGLPVNTTIVGFGNPDTEFQNSDIRSFSSYAFFGQVSFSFLDDFTLTGGARWTENEFTDLRCNIFGGCLTNAGRTGTPATPSEKDSNVTFKAAIDYAVTDDNMLYASFATGIKPAASNNGFVQDPNGVGFFPEIFDEEEVTSYEIGSKNFFLDRRLRVNAAAFYYDIDNYLFNSAGLNLTGSGVSGGSNLPSSEVYGLEIEAVAALRDDLRLDASVTASDSKITTGRLAVDRADQINITAGLTTPAARTAAILTIVQDVTGNELPKIPDLVANVRLTYDREIQDTGVLTSTITYTHRGEYFARVYNSTRDIVESYDLVDLNFHFQPHDSDWGFDFGVQNLLDSDEVGSVHTDDFFQGVTSFQLLPPRLVTLRARYNF
jgi:iron complex outermembrane receptor protein